MGLGKKRYALIFSEVGKTRETLLEKRVAEAAAAPALVCLVYLLGRWARVKKPHQYKEGKVNIVVNDETICDWSFSVELLAKSGES